MPVVKSLEDLRRLREEALRKREARATSARVQITVLMGTCGIAAGSRDTMKAILQVIESEGLQGVLIKQAGCIGLCEQEPIVQVETADEPTVRYGKVSAERATQIMKEHVMGGNVVTELQISAEESGCEA